MLQYVEGLSDRQAADAVRGRIDWKYALGLPLTDPGFDHTVLSEFRSRLVEGKAERLLLDTLLKRLEECDLVKARGRQRTDSTHVLADVRRLNRLERVGETLRAALNELAMMAPEWLQTLALTADRIDLAAGVLVIESLKKRRTGIYRAVPVPPALLDALDLVHGIRELHASRGKGRGELLWPWSRMTGWRAVHAVMAAAGLDGPQASPKGLRHGFGVSAVSAGIPLNLVQKWLGHASTPMRLVPRRRILPSACGGEVQMLRAQNARNRQTQNDGGIRIWSASRATPLSRPGRASVISRSNPSDAIMR